MAAPESGDRYVPALRFRALTAAYDPVVRVSTREAEFKKRLLMQAGLRAGDRVLDLGCGTGTLAIEAKLAQPEAEVAGIDGDPAVLERARSKAAEAALEIGFEQGLSTDLPYADQTFDVVLSTLLFHHLTGAAKARTATEVARILRPGGRLQVADWGRPADPLMRALFLGVRVLDGFEQTRDNTAGALPRIFADAGLVRSGETERLRTVLGTIALYRADAPAADR